MCGGSNSRYFFDWTFPRGPKVFSRRRKLFAVNGGCGAGRTRRAVDLVGSGRHSSWKKEKAAQGQAEKEPSTRIGAAQSIQVRSHLSFFGGTNSKERIKLLREYVLDLSRIAAVAWTGARAA
jgi:hypothetical protein